MNEEFKIEKNIPMPTNRGPVSRYPLKDMEIGDSFFVAGRDHAARNIRGVLQRHRPKRFSVRMQDGGIRVWRIE